VTLPFLVKDRRTKWIYFFVGGASTLLLYQVTNRLHLYEPQLLPFDLIDDIMPFWPWTVWVYFSEYVIFLAAYFGLRKKEHVTRYFYAYMGILLFSIVVFIFYPVTFPRDAFPVVGDSFSERALAFLRTHMDEPANCLPSLHVSSCFISAFCFWQESRRKFALFFLWAFLVSISTMTTKQHYFVDVWAAFLLTAVAYWIFFYKVKLSGGPEPAQGVGKAAGAKR
jgi:membrane-associated phospholipid phosphatase